MKNLIPRMATINEASEITGLARYFIRQLALTGNPLLNLSGEGLF